LECRLLNPVRHNTLGSLGLLNLIFLGGRTVNAENRTWQELCDAASKEPDPEQLMVLVSELMKALDNRKAPARGTREQ